MFKSAITSTPLTSSAANNFFSKIQGGLWNNDCSLVSTLRALVYPRMKDDDSLYVIYSSSCYTASQLSSWSIRDALRKFLNAPEYMSSGCITVHNFYSSDSDDNSAWMSLIESSFEEKYEGWHRLEKMTEFYRRSFQTLCYINPELRSVYIFVENLDLKKLHYLQCSVFAFLPWYFDPSEGVSELEMELIKSFREKTATKYLDCIAKIAEQYDFRTERIRTLLRGFETKYERMECDNVRRQQENTISKINNYNEQIASLMKQYNDTAIRLLGLEAKIASGESAEDSEIMDYFLSNKHLILECVNDSYMTFIVKDYLLYFDEEMAASMISNRSSYIYRHPDINYSSYIPADDMELLMKAIFIDQTLKIRICAAYRFALNGSVNGLQEYDFPAECSTSIPNLHIDGFSCLGNYNSIINSFLLKHDYISAIEQCIASCKSLNFADSTVMKAFMREMYGRGSRNSRCIELPNGEVADAQEAIKWLKKETEEEVNE